MFKLNLTNCRTHSYLGFKFFEQFSMCIHLLVAEFLKLSYFIGISVESDRNFWFFHHWFNNIIRHSILFVIEKQYNV